MAFGATPDTACMEATTIKTETVSMQTTTIKAETVTMKAAEIKTENCISGARTVTMAIEEASDTTATEPPPLIDSIPWHPGTLASAQSS